MLGFEFIGASLILLFTTIQYACLSRQPRSVSEAVWRGMNGRGAPPSQ
jgi:hypothetical protein